jgi:hypothetical protein
MSALKDGRIALLYEGDGGLHLARFWPEDANLAAVPQSRDPTNARTEWWLGRPGRKLQEAKEAQPDLLFLGDSLTQGWEDAGAKVWKLHYEHRNAANFGFEGDSTQHLLWRIERGALDGLSPKLIVLLIGAYNANHRDFSPDQIVGGVEAVLERIRQKCPSSRVLLLGLLPRDLLADSELRHTGRRHRGRCRPIPASGRTRSSTPARRSRRTVAAGRGRRRSRVDPGCSWQCGTNPRCTLRSRRRHRRRARSNTGRPRRRRSPGTS